MIVLENFFWYLVIGVCAVLAFLGMLPLLAMLGAVAWGALQAL